jgi:hypothetical protein
MAKGASLGSPPSKVQALTSEVQGLSKKLAVPSFEVYFKLLKQKAGWRSLQRCQKRCQT